MGWFPLRSRWFAWWYAAIAVGFLLLAITQGIIGAGFWPVALRILIALGFAALSVFEFQTRDRPR
jgi:hypothetical protein